MALSPSPEINNNIIAEQNYITFETYPTLTMLRMAATGAGTSLDRSPPPAAVAAVAAAAAWIAERPSVETGWPGSFPLAAPSSPARLPPSDLVNPACPGGQLGWPFYSDPSWRDWDTSVVATERAPPVVVVA